MKKTKKGDEVDVDFFVELHGKKFQEQIHRIYDKGLPSKDKLGHSEHVSVRVHPWQRDVLGEIREAIPGKWKTESDLVRTILGLGLSLAKECLGSALIQEENRQISQLFMLLTDIQRIKNRNDIIEQAREAFKVLNSLPSFDLEEEIERLKKMKKSLGERPKAQVVKMEAKKGGNEEK